MILETASEKMHICHLFHLVSSYEESPEMVQQLIDHIKEAQIEAKEKRTTIIVDQDSGEFFVTVHQTGVIQLCAVMKSFEAPT